MATTRIIPLHTGKGRSFSKAIIDYVATRKRRTTAGSIPGCLWPLYRPNEGRFGSPDAELFQRRFGPLKPDKGKNKGKHSG